MESIALDLLASDNYIPVNRTLVKLIGLEEAVILGELCTQHKHWKAEGRLIDDMFYCTVEKLEERTGLTEYQQRKAIKGLIDLGILLQELRGIPATRYFRINVDKLCSIFQTSSEKTKELEPEKLQSSNSINIIENSSNKKSISKDIDLGHFEFGKSKKPEQNMYSKCLSHIREFTDNPDVLEFLKDFLALLSQMNKLRGEKQFIGILNKLKSITEDPDKQITVIKNSIEHGYGTFYDCLQDKRPYFRKEKQASTDIGHTSERAKKGGPSYEKF